MQHRISAQEGNSVHAPTYAACNAAGMRSCLLLCCSWLLTPLPPTLQAFKSDVEAYDFISQNQKRAGDNQGSIGSQPHAQGYSGTQGHAGNQTYAAPQGYTGQGYSGQGYSGQGYSGQGYGYGSQGYGNQGYNGYGSYK